MARLALGIEIWCPACRAWHVVAPPRGPVPPHIRTMLYALCGRTWCYVGRIGEETPLKVRRAMPTHRRVRR
jgi:hypothetical protein